jgi:hypothetical protein
MSLYKFIFKNPGRGLIAFALVFKVVLSACNNKPANNSKDSLAKGNEEEKSNSQVFMPMPHQENVDTIKVNCAVIKRMQIDLDLIKRAAIVKGKLSFDLSDAPKPLQDSIWADVNGFGLHDVSRRQMRSLMLRYYLTDTTLICALSPVWADALNTPPAIVLGYEKKEKYIAVTLLYNHFLYNELIFATISSSGNFLGYQHLGTTGGDAGIVDFRKVCEQRDTVWFYKKHFEYYQITEEEKKKIELAKSDSERNELRASIMRLTMQRDSVSMSRIKEANCRDGYFLTTDNYGQIITNSPKE